MITRVVHVNSPEWAQAVKDGIAVYIGRAVPRKGFSASKWANPYRIGVDGSREEVIDMYANMLREKPDLARTAFYTLQGKVLGCWCRPKECHGDVLAWLADASFNSFGMWLDGYYSMRDLWDYKLIESMEG